MSKKIIVGGCSFTLGNELSDDKDGHTPSKRSWAYRISENLYDPYICVARGGSGNSGIARRMFDAISRHPDVHTVAVMWTFTSRYDWAMPRHKKLEKTRWASISPWDTTEGQDEAAITLSGSETQQQEWAERTQDAKDTGVKDFADALYKKAANDYHETYLSWKSIIWLQNLLEKKNIKYFFTLADNSLFYQEMTAKKNEDKFMASLHKEIDFSHWYNFGERNMGFNQWALLNDYERGTTHPLDKAHEDAVKLMLPTFKKLTGE